MARLIITEKPSTAKAVAEFLGVAKKTSAFYQTNSGDYVASCLGHLMEQYEPEDYYEEWKKWDLGVLPMIPREWKKRVRKDGKQKVDAIKQLLPLVDEVVHAGDADREGNLLVDEVLEHLKNRLPVKRLWLSAFDTLSIKRGMENIVPESQYKGFSFAAEGRARSDWLIGMNMSRGVTKLWEQGGNRTTLHIGRVKTPALWFVYEREMAIAKFKPVDYFVGECVFQHQNGSFKVTWCPPQGVPVDDAGRVLDQKFVKDAIHKVSGKPGVITRLETKPGKSNAPLPFSQADIQKKAGRRFGLSPEQVLDICQKLYETYKLTTYPRTDCAYLPESQLADAPIILDALRSNFGDAFPKFSFDANKKSRAWNDKKISAHHGIIPTSEARSLAGLSQDERSVYEMIVQHYLAQFMPECLFETTEVEVTSESELFAAKGVVEIQAGWKALFRSRGDDSEESDDEKAAKLPEMNQGDPGKMGQGEVLSKRTTPPKPFTQPDLIDAMQNAHRYIGNPQLKTMLKTVQGIGTEAARANLVKELFEKGYLEELGKGKNKSIKTTLKGRELCESLPDQLLRPDMSAYFEELLGRVQSQTLPLPQFMQTVEAFVVKMLDEMKAGRGLKKIPKGVGAPASVVCPVAGCGLQSTRRQKKGSSAHFWVCENSHFMDDKGGKPVPREEVDAKCECGGKLLPRNGPTGKFYGCSNYPTCKKTYKPAAKSRAGSRRTNV